MYLTLHAASSPLIILSSVKRIDIFKHIFGSVLIPESVYQETITKNKVQFQKQEILRAIDQRFVKVVTPQTEHVFKRKIDDGEKGVFNLAFDIEADLILIDDKRAVKEAMELGFRVFGTSNILKQAEELQLIDSYLEIKAELEKLNIFLQ